MNDALKEDNKALTEQIEMLTKMQVDQHKALADEFKGKCTDWQSIVENMEKFTTNCSNNRGNAGAKEES